MTENTQDVDALVATVDAVVRDFAAAGSCYGADTWDEWQSRDYEEKLQPALTRLADLARKAVPDTHEGYDEARYSAALVEIAELAADLATANEQRDEMWMYGRALAKAAEKVIAGEWDAVAMQTRIGDFYATTACSPSRKGLSHTRNLTGSPFGGSFA